MSDNQSLLFQLEELLHWKKSKKVYAEKLGITEEEVSELMKELKKKDNIEESVTINSSNRKVNVEKGTIESTIVVNFEPKDDLELATLHKINLDKYVITNYWSKLLPNGKFTSSVFSKRRQAKDYTLEDFEKFLQNYVPTFTLPEKKKTNPILDTIDVEISISDFHIGKKTLEGESMFNKKVQFINVLADLLFKVTNNYNIDTIVFPIGNDYFHTDNYQNQTTNGTPQDVLVEYANEYEEGFDLLVGAIQLLNLNARNIEIILVQGNHDRTKSFYLAHALEVFFKGNKKVKFKREHSTTKFTVLGNTFIGYHHGNCKIEELPLVFATNKDSSVAFGNALYRHVHTGDKHHYMAKEIKGVRIQQMPSLSGTDRWHLDNNYINNVRAGLVHLFHPIYGKIGEFESRI
jgi:DNA-binding Lrp family transcriptional regulator